MPRSVNLFGFHAARSPSRVAPGVLNTQFRFDLPTQMPPPKPGSYFDLTRTTDFEVAGKKFSFSPGEKILDIAFLGLLVRYEVARKLFGKVFNAVAIQTRTFRTGELLTFKKIIIANAIAFAGFKASTIGLKLIFGDDIIKRITKIAVSPFVTLKDNLLGSSDDFAVPDIGVGNLIADLKVDPTIRG